MESSARRTGHHEGVDNDTRRHPSTSFISHDHHTHPLCKLRMAKRKNSGDGSPAGDIPKKRGCLDDESQTPVQFTDESKAGSQQGEETSVGQQGEMFRNKQTASLKQARLARTRSGTQTADAFAEGINDLTARDRLLMLMLPAEIESSSTLLHLPGFGGWTPNGRWDAAKTAPKSFMGEAWETIQALPETRKVACVKTPFLQDAKPAAFACRLDDLGARDRLLLLLLPAEIETTIALASLSRFRQSDAVAKWDQAKTTPPRSFVPETSQTLLALPEVRKVACALNPTKSGNRPEPPTSTASFSIVPTTVQQPDVQKTSARLHWGFTGATTTDFCQQRSGLLLVMSQLCCWSVSRAKDGSGQIALLSVNGVRSLC